MNTIYIQYFKTPYGELILGAFNQQLCLCDWRYRKMRNAIDQRIQKGLDTVYLEEKTGTIHAARQQLNEYFAGERTEFNVPLLMVGTSFQQSIWNELLKIPYGNTESYLGLSKKINNLKAIRAVAAANGANAISIFVPCHRILGRNGELTGYAGGLNTKRKLLQLESIQQNTEQLQLFSNI